MDSFLEKEYLVQLKVLDHLIKNKSTLLEATENLQINYKTLKSIITQLKINIEDAGLNDEIEIITYDKGKIGGIAKGVSFERLGFYFLQHSFNYKIVEAFFFGKFRGVDNYANQEFISHTTAFRRIAQVKLILEDFGLNIKLATGEFIGEETQKRLFFFFFYWYSYRFYHLLSNESEWKKMDCFVTDIFSVMGTPMAYHLKRKYMLIFVITVKRIQHHKLVDYKRGQQLYRYLIENSPKFGQFYKATLNLFQEFGIFESKSIESEIAILYEVLLTDRHLLPASETQYFKNLYPNIEKDSIRIYSLGEQYLGTDKISSYKEQIQDSLFCGFLKSFMYYGKEEDFIPFYKKDSLEIPMEFPEKGGLREVYENNLPKYAQRELRYQLLTLGMMFHSLGIRIRPTLNIAILVMSHEYVVYYLKSKIEELLKDSVSISFYLKDDTDVIISDVIDTKWDEDIPVYTFVIGKENWADIILFINKAIKKKEELLALNE